MSNGPTMQQGAEINRPHSDLRPGTTVDLDPRRNIISPPPEVDRDRVLRNQADLARKIAGEGVNEVARAAANAGVTHGTAKLDRQLTPSQNSARVAEVTAANVRERLVGVGDASVADKITQAAIADALHQAKDLTPSSPDAARSLGPVDETLKFDGFKHPGRVNFYPQPEPATRYNRAA